jgi:hypothetical protein
VKRYSKVTIMHAVYTQEDIIIKSKNLIYKLAKQLKLHNIFRYFSKHNLKLAKTEFPTAAVQNNSKIHFDKTILYMLLFLK